MLLILTSVKELLNFFLYLLTRIADGDEYSWEQDSEDALDSRNIIRLLTSLYLGRFSYGKSLKPDNATNITKSWTEIFRKVDT